MANSTIRYGVSLRKRYQAILHEKKARYRCDLCGKVAVKRVGTGIWKCRYCDAVFAGGAYTLKTAAGEASNMILSRSAGG